MPWLCPFWRTPGRMKGSAPTPGKPLPPRFGARFGWRGRARPMRLWALADGAEGSQARSLAEDLDPGSGHPGEGRVRSPAGRISRSRSAEYRSAIIDRVGRHQSGSRRGRDFGIDLRSARRKRRAYVRPCLDWSERRPHLAGAVGAALAKRCFQRNWIERVKDTRALKITTSGNEGFRTVFGLEWAS